MARVEELRIFNRLEEIKKLQAILERLGASWRIPARDLCELNLILEELCVNHMVHGRGRAGDIIVLRFSLHSDIIRVTVITHGPPFDPLAVPEPDVQLPPARREAGGLGLHLVRHYADEIRYSRDSERGENRLEIEKKLSEVNSDCWVQSTEFGVQSFIRMWGR